MVAARVEALSDPPVATHSPILEIDRGFDLAQGIRLLTAVAWVSWALVWWETSGYSGIAPYMSLFALGGGLGIGASAMSSLSPVRARQLSSWVMVGTVIIVGTWLVVRAPVHDYGTDEITTGQASATVLLHGSNPYTTDLTPELRAFNLPAAQATPVYGGTVVHTTSYPALSFLFYAPFGALLGTTSPYALVVDDLAWLVFVLLLWRLFDERQRTLLPLIASAFFFVAFVDGGVTDSLFLPFLCAALFRWDRFIDGSRLGRWSGPIALGVACAVKPLPWLLVPFLVSGIALEAKARGRDPRRLAAGYGATVLAAFAIPNAPFLVMDPSAWARGMLLPLVQPLVPFGQGLVQLPMYAHIAGGHVGLLGPAAMGALLAALGGFILWYPRTRRLLPLLATVPLLFSTRSLINYFSCVLLLLCITGAGPNRLYPSETSRRARRAGGIPFAAGLVVCAGAWALFLAAPAPLRLDVVAASHPIIAPGRTEVRLSLDAFNRSGSAVRPRFAVTSGGFVDAAWHVLSGPAVILPGARAKFVLVPDDARTTLSPGVAFLVDALATNPDSVSTSAWVIAS